MKEHTQILLGHNNKHRRYEKQIDILEEEEEEEEENKE
jgi:hypothetical protein